MASSKHGVPRLTDSNYFTWKVRIFDLLVIKDCEGAIADPEHDQSAKALAYIRAYVEDEYLPIIRVLPNAHDAWNALEAVFQARSTASACASRSPATTAAPFASHQSKNAASPRVAEPVSVKC